MQLMQQKRQNERQRDQVYQQQFNIDQLAFTKEMIQDTKVQVEAMRSVKNFLTFLIGLMYSPTNNYGTLLLRKLFITGLLN